MYQLLSKRNITYIDNRFEELLVELDHDSYNVEYFNNKINEK